eukprot:g12981.t2
MITMEDDSRTPLLPRDGRPQEIKLPTTKLASLGISLAFAVFTDFAVCWLVCTGGFSDDWRQRLGLSHDGPYPFGSAGLDLLLAAGLRLVVAIAGCLAFFLVVYRSDSLRAVGHPDAEYYGRTTAAVAHARERCYKWACAPRTWQGLKRSVNDNGGGGGEDEAELGDGEDIQGNTAPRGGSTPYEVTGLSRWLEAFCPAASFLTVLLIVAKCLVRLLVGTGWSALGTPWFWVAVGWSAAASGVEFVLATSFTSTCRRYCFLHLCREKGDYEAALEAGRDGGMGMGGKKNDEYSATIEDILVLCSEDWRLILCAFAALLLAATSQVLIPHFTGNMIDNVVERGDSRDFHRSTLYLVLAAFGCATFSGIRSTAVSLTGDIFRDKLAEAGSVAEESLGSMTTVRSFAAEERESKEYSRKLQDYYALSLKGGYAYGFYAASFVLLPNLVTAVVLFYGGQLVMQGQISGGKVVSFMIYLTSLSDGFNDMASIFSSMTQAVGAADKVFEYINREPRGATPTGTRPPARADVGMRSGAQASAAAEAGEKPENCLGAVELRNVDFEYPSRPGRRILDGVSFNAAAGQVLALVGPSGGGKSSCIALLENLYHPSRGQVMLDGLAVHKYDHHWLHRNISIVGQEPTLYARSIRENITYGLEGEEPSMVEVERAAKLANAHTFISQLPERYETHAGERGVQMSGGQKQRIAIARALVRKPKVLLLDEATSALDAESEHLVQQAIDNMIARGGMTVILIAHRLSTVKRADKIVVIRSGRVAEEGTHDQLVSVDGGVYASLVKRQLDLGDSSSSNGGGRKGEPRIGGDTPKLGLAKRV